MINSRALLITVIFILFFALLVVKLVNIQIVRSDELKYYAQRQQTKLETIKAERGLIYDRNNLLLVYNRSDITFYLDLRMVSNDKKETVAEKFSSVFGKSKSHYLKLMDRKGRTIVLEKKAPSEKAILLKDFKITGLFSVEEPTRVYQYGSLASHVLGYVNNEFVGVNGVAKAFEDLLNGEDGRRLVERDAIGGIISVSDEETVPPVPGYNLILTIDKNYQSILEDELQKGLENFGGESAIGIIMDPNSGEILALANIADYDPNYYWKYPDYLRRNRSVTDTYEPGSTFKAFTLAALLDAGLVKESDLVFVENGKYKFRNTYIKDTHKNTYLTVAGVVKESSNIGIAKLVQKLNDDTYYKYLRGFGFGTYTSIPLPGESKGVLKKPNYWSGLSKVYMSFGYEISVTPLQLITAYSALINGGVLYEPRVVKRETDKNGSVVYESNAVAVRRVITENTSARLRKVLRGVVESGTGKLANLDFINIGGKTGTTQILVDGKYSKQKYNASFIGFFPAENPRLICLILVNSPKVSKYGGKVAAPIFKEVAAKIILSNKGKFLDRQLKQENSIKTKWVKTETKQNKIIITPVGNDINNFVDSENNYSGLMPDLRGRTVKDALVTLNLLGLKYDINGSGVVTYQSINPGTLIQINEVVEINCSETSIKGVNIY
ncbi:stage V sporulation protein D [bacterium BMS3Abin03]|nr:stage V sporulation protein D [bacterium BMS3Abin03]